MSGTSNTGSLRLTPKNRLTPVQLSGKPAREDTGLSLSLKTIIGTTTGSANAFDSDHESHTFAVCAGSAVVLGQVDDTPELNVTRRFFRARSDGWPVSATPSFYSSPVLPGISDSRIGLTSFSKDGGHGLATGSFTTGSHPTESPVRGKGNKKIRDATCVSLSPGAKLLAVGETGYNPRILIFSTAPDAQLDVPLSSISEHSFGVRACAFSPDSRWLCSLGNVHDGFVYLWSINPKSGSCKLQFSNKVTSFVQNMVWMGNSVITVGTRHVKVWRLEQPIPASPSKKRFDGENSFDGGSGSPVPRTFSGRNCLLGPLIDASFNCVVTISDRKAIICTDKGDVCLLDDTDRNQRLNRVAKTGSSISCVTVDKINKCLWMGGTQGKLWTLPLDLLTCGTVVPDHLVSPFNLDLLTCLGPSHCPDICAIASLCGHIVTVESDHIIGVKGVTNTVGGSVITTEQRVPAHDSAVLGVRALHQPNDYDAEFFTWSAQGTVIFWLFDGAWKGKLEVALDQPADAEEGGLNELRVMRAYESDRFFVSGDKYGVLRIIDSTGRDLTVLKAHDGEIHDVALMGRDVKDVFVVSCGRDRTLQLFRKAGDTLTLQQTLDDHAATVCNVMFMNLGSTLLSSSSDRTIIIRTLATGESDKVAFIPIRVITLKASPLAFSALPESNALVVSTLDRQIHKYELSSGRLIQSFRASEHNGSHSLAISSLSVQQLEKGSRQVPILLGVSSTDKSIGLYDYENGSILSNEYGQTAISDIAFIQRHSDSGDANAILISTGLDGTIMIWDLVARSRFLARPNENVKGESAAESLKTHTSALSKPLRKVLSKSEIQGFQRSLETDVDSPTPSRSHSPSRIRKKGSKYTLASTPRVAIPAEPTSTHHSLSSSSAAQATGRRLLHDHSSTPPSPRKPGGNIRSKPSWNDGRHRRKSTSNLNDITMAAEQICKSLRVYRKMMSSSTEIVKRDTADDLERELRLTIEAITERTKKTQVVNEIISGDLLDAYLAKMIDDRLAALGKPDDMADTSGGANEVETKETEASKTGTGGMRAE